MSTNKLNEILSKLKEYEEILQEDNNDEIDESLSSSINDTLNELNSLMVKETTEIINKIDIKFINKSKNPDPTYAYEGDSGFDLRANIDEPVTIQPFKIAKIPTGLFFELEKGLEIQVRPRSGLSTKFGVTVINTPGTVDSHYRGEVSVPLINFGDEPFIVNNGDRIAQAVIMPVFGEGKVSLIKTNEINKTTRGDGGFNSSGIS